MICFGTAQFENKLHYKKLCKSYINFFSFLICHTITHLLQFITEKLANALSASNVCTAVKIKINNKFACSQPTRTKQFFPVIIGTFRLEGEHDYEYEFSVLSTRTSKKCRPPNLMRMLSTENLYS